MTTFNVKGVASDEPADNYDPTLLLSSALWTAVASFSSLFSFYGPQLDVWITLTTLINLVSATKQFSHLLSNKQQTGTDRNQQVDNMEH